MSDAMEPEWDTIWIVYWTGKVLTSIPMFLDRPDAEAWVPQELIEGWSHLIYFYGTKSDFDPSEEKIT